MAKVSIIKFKLHSKEYIINVNCGSDGEFSVNLPEEIYKPLNLESKIRTTTLRALEIDFQAALKKYKEASVTEEVLIAIGYGAAGKFSEFKNGDALFYDKYGVRIEWSQGKKNVLSFDYHIIVKETVAGEVNYFEAWDGARMDQFRSFDDKKKYDKKKYYKGWSKFSHSDHYKLIPWSEPAQQSLDNALEKIRAVSELLFNFISLSENQIEGSLTKTKLLS